MTRSVFMGLPLDLLSMEGTVQAVSDALDKGPYPYQHMVINAAKVVKCRGDSMLKNSVLESDLVNADGQSIVWAGKFLGLPVPERVAGIDLMARLLALAEKRGASVYFLGATDAVLDRLIARVRSEHPQLKVAGSQNGYFSLSESSSVARKIAQAHADLLFVGMPTPKKEIFVHQQKSDLKVKFCMGVGGSFDVLAGITRRAPRWMQICGLEWFYRILQEPRRLFARYFTTNFAFVYLVMKEKIMKQGLQEVGRSND